MIDVIKTDIGRTMVQDFIEKGIGNPDEIASTIRMASPSELCEMIQDLPRYKMEIADKQRTYRTTLVYEVAYKRIGYEVAINNLKKYNKQ